MNLPDFTMTAGARSLPSEHDGCQKRDEVCPFFDIVGGQNRSHSVHKTRQYPPIYNPSARAEKQRDRSGTLYNVKEYEQMVLLQE